MDLAMFKRGLHFSNIIRVSRKHISDVALQPEKKAVANSEKHVAAILTD